MLVAHRVTHPQAVASNDKLRRNGKLEEISSAAAKRVARTVLHHTVVLHVCLLPLLCLCRSDPNQKTLPDQQQVDAQHTPPIESLLTVVERLRHKQMRLPLHPEGENTLFSRTPQPASLYCSCCTKVGVFFLFRCHRLPPEVRTNAPQN